MDQKQIDFIKKQSTSSVIYLSLRNLALQAVSFIGFFILTILLGTGEVGLFAIVSESIAILGYFSDVGLASALIQQKRQPSKIALRTAFTIQQILVIILLLIVALSYPQIRQNRHYGDKESWLLLSLCFSFMAASFKTIPSILLERKLNFKLLSTIDIAENITFYLIAVILASLGFGVYSYTIANFFRSLLGLLLIYIYSPWSLGLALSFKVAKKLFTFGIPFQLNTIIAMAKDRLSNLVVAGIIGRQSFGILSWAQKGPRLPLGLMDSIMRVSFPAFSRLQANPEILKRSLEKSLYFIALFIFPALAGIALIAPDFINIIPKYQKWIPALIPLYFYALSFAIASITTPLTNAFNATGRIKTTTAMMLMWTILTWIFYPYFSLKYGYVGTSLAALLVSSSSFVVWILAKSYFQTNIIRVIFQPLLSTTLMTLILGLFNLLSLPPLNNFLGKIILGSSFYLGYHLLFQPEPLKWFTRQLQCYLNKKSS